MKETKTTDDRGGSLSCISPALVMQILHCSRNHALMITLDSQNKPWISFSEMKLKVVLNDSEVYLKAIGICCLYVTLAKIMNFTVTIFRYTYLHRLFIDVLFTLLTADINISHSFPPTVCMCVPDADTQIKAIFIRSRRSNVGLSHNIIRIRCYIHYKQDKCRLSIQNR